MLFFSFFRLYLVGVVLLTDEFLLEINDHLPLLLHLDLQQCPNITDRKLEDIIKKSHSDLEIVNYYGEIIQQFAIFSLSSDDEKSESSSTEGAVKSDEISDGFSDPNDF